MKKTFVLSLLVSALLLGPAVPATADTVYEHADVYASTAECTEARDEVSHGSGGGYIKVDTMSVAVFSTIAGGNMYCYSQFDRPAGYIATAMSFWKWTGAEWAVCTSMADYYYNPTKTWITTLDWNNGTQPPCGNGYYGTMGDHYVLNEDWKGGSLWSGYHWLPT